MKEKLVTVMFLKKRTLGQHFLRSRAALLKIVSAANLSPEDTVLEVGPGEGALTELLLERAGKVIAVEKDDRLLPILRRRFQNEVAVGELTLVRGDILKFPISNLQFPKKSYKIVANLPYYITGKFLRKFLEDEPQPQSMTLLLQKEVAKRIVAADKKESILSISVKAYGTPRYIATVKAGSFAPPPKVDSAILTITGISKNFFTDGSVEAPKTTRSDLVKEREEAFFALLKKGFAHPRKLLAGNLGIPKETLTQYGIAENARPENLSVFVWKRLYKAISTRRVEESAEKRP